MSTVEDLRTATATTPWTRWLAFAAATLCLAFFFFRAPEPASAATNSSYRMLLDIAYRPSAAATMPVQTLDGPLVPLQNPVYVGRSIWRAIVWQLAANLAMAAVLAGSLVRLPPTRAWWAGALLIIFGMTESSLIPWVTIFILGHGTARAEQSLLRLLGGLGLGILGLTSVPHLLFAVGAIALQAIPSTRRPDRGGYTAAGFLVGAIAMWLLLDQPLQKFGRWLWFGCTGAWTPSALALPSATVGAFLWIALAFVVWLAALFFSRATLRAKSVDGPDALLLTWGLFLAWKLVAVQPAGTPWFFFATVIMAAFRMLPVIPWASAALFVIGVLGAATPDRTLLSDAAGRINRQVLRNLDDLRQLGSLRERLRQDFTGYGASFAMPQTRAALTNGPVGLVGDQAMAAILNELRVTLAPGFGTTFIRDDEAARASARALLEAEAPPFSLQRIDRDGDLLPGLRDGPAQLALHRGYTFVLSEQGMSLWKKNTAVPVAPLQLVKTGTVRFGEKIVLSPAEESSWIELECSPKWIGLLRDQLRPLAEPAVRVENAHGDELRYALPWRMARAGFLAQPFLAGDIDLLKFQEGQSLPRLRSVAVEAPSSGIWLWRSEISYRLYRFPALVSAEQANLTAPLQKQFAALNRLPSAVSCPFPPLFGVVLAKPAVFLHPNSAMELVATAEDRTVQGSFGIAPGAYANSGPNVTDGVAFKIEFLAASGAKLVLLERYLDPVAVTEDRGPQAFTVKIPASAGGRLIFRTFNLPHKTSSFDWAYWREIELK
jgi:hypothetical protein